MFNIKTGPVILKGHPQFDSFQFVIKAIGKDESRTILMHLLVEVIEGDVYYIATDGRRLHSFTFSKQLFPNDEFNEVLEPGLYELISKSSKAICFVKVDEETEEGMNYPSWQQIMPIDRSAPTDHLAVDKTNYGRIMAKTGGTFNVKFLEDATGVKITNENSVRYEYTDGKLLLEHELGTAVLMPLIRGAEEAEETENEESESGTPDLPDID